MQLWLASCLDAYYIHCIGAGVGSVWNRVGSASRGLQRCEDPVSGAGGVQLWVSRPLIEAKVVARPTFLPRAHIRQHNLLTNLIILFWLPPCSQNDNSQAETLTNGVRHADPPDPMDDVLEVLMKNGGECQSFHSFEDEMVSVDMDDEAVNVYYMRNQIDESQKLA